MQFLYAANQHNVQTHFSCAIGNDDFGKSFINSFKSDLCTLSVHESDLPTGVCLIFITSDGQRTMVANLGANTNIQTECIDEEKLKHLSIFYSITFLYLLRMVLMLQNFVCSDSIFKSMLWYF